MQQLVALAHGLEQALLERAHGALGAGRELEHGLIVDLDDAGGQRDLELLNDLDELVDLRTGVDLLLGASAQ